MAASRLFADCRLYRIFKENGGGKIIMTASIKYAQLSGVPLLI